MSKSIRLSDEAYDRLAWERPLLELAGVLTDELEAAIEERRDQRAEELETVTERRSYRGDPLKRRKPSRRQRR